MPARGYEPAQYLNVDLDVESLAPLDALIAHLDDHAILLHDAKRGRVWFASFELLSQRRPRNADQTIRAFVKILRALPAAPRRQWHGFNIGIQAGMEPRCLEEQIDAGTIAGVAALRASLAVTVYPPARPPPRRTKVV